MEITGFGYLAFFSLVLLGHYLLTGRDTAQKGLLTAASYYFYATLDWRFLGLLFGFTVLNWMAGEAVANSSKRRDARLAVAIAVLSSLGLLFYFKYLNFFGGMVNSLADWMGQDALVPLVGVLLPVGISFLAFQAITYPIDLYAGRLQQRASFGDFCLYMAFFPRLLAGPIVPAAQFLPQLQKPLGEVSADQRFSGATLVMCGLVKKVILADTLGTHLVDPAFATPGSYSTAFLWLALFGYSMQSYLDLSGYTDIALGTARMLGYTLPPNFNRPYMAVSIANFWQRWHISMSSFFRNYLYQPLKNNWKAPTTVNLLITFVAIGLWHGAGWNFICYGLLHGSMVAFEQWRNQRRRAAGLPQPVYHGSRLVARVAWIFLLVALARLLFRATDLDGAGVYFSLLLVEHGGSTPLTWPAVVALLGASLLHWSPLAWRDRLHQWVGAQPAWRFGAQSAALVYLLIAFSPGTARFIYFQF